jgi:tetratricopeptide (TPR) repeat protein
MISVKMGTTIKHIYQILVLTLMLCIMPIRALAVTWEPLARTGRHDVSIDTASIRLTNLSRLAVWLRFIPIGEQQRKQAATEYGQKSYRLHLEYYEIDCSEQNAVLGLVDILGPAHKRLARTKGGSTPDAIIPGSVLDIAYLKVCPALEEEASNNADEIPASESDSNSAPDDTEQKQLSEELQQAIASALQKTESEPKNFESWRDLGNTYFDADMHAEAITAYNKALAIKPDDTDVLNDQGAMFRQTGDFAKALANFEKARLVDPYNLESLYNSGYVLAFDLNKIENALVLWRRYLTLDSTSETSHQVQSFVDRYDTSVRAESKKLK